MEVCLMVEGQEDVTWPQWIALAQACESAGIAALFRSDHYLSVSGKDERGSLDAWGTICGLSAVTSRLRLGTLVSPATFRHPSVLSKLVTTADQISGGRIELGIGAGWMEAEHTAFGFPFGSPRSRGDALAEQIEIVSRTLSGERFSFSGDRYRIEELASRPQPVQRPRPPIILGGSGGPRSVALAARWADEYNTPDPTDEQIRACRAALNAACARVGRDPETLPLSIMCGALVGADHRELEQRAVALAHLDGEQTSDPAAYLERLPGEWVVGTPAQAIERLRRLQSLGVERVMLQHLLHRDLDAVALIGREIAPALRRRDDARRADLQAGAVDR